MTNNRPRSKDFVPYVYILASDRNGTIYVGATSNLVQRVWQHRTKVTGGFTAEYNVQSLVWYEQHATMDAAIAREKVIKKWNRKWKLELIESSNPDWQDLYESIL